MHVLFTITATILSSGTLAAIAAAAEPPQRLPLESEFIGPGAHVSVLLPEAYTAEPEARFRVLYVLPVEPGDERRFGDPLAVIQALGLHDKHRLICVEPAFDTWPWYGDHATNKQVRHDSHMVHAVIPFIEGQFRTLAKPEGRLLLGFSKSGSGAISLLLRHGDVFGFAASWDAPLMLTDRQFGIWKTDELGVPHVYDADITAPHSWHKKWVAPLVGMLMKMSSSADLQPPPTSDVK